MLYLHLNTFGEYFTQVWYIATYYEYYVKNHRRKVISARSDWMSLAVIGAQTPPKNASIPFLGTT